MSICVCSPCIDVGVYLSIYTNLSIYLYQFIYLSIYLYIYLSKTTIYDTQFCGITYPIHNLSRYLSISIYQFVYLFTDSVYLSLQLPTYLYLSIPIYLSINLFNTLSSFIILRYAFNRLHISSYLLVIC